MATAPGCGRPSWPALAAETGLEITVCHFPPGTSKWNKIEHRLFSHISMNWRGRPLTSHEVIVSLIAQHAHPHRPDRRRQPSTQSQYPKGIKVSDQRDAGPRASQRLRRHDWHPEWNYCLTGPSTAMTAASRPTAISVLLIYRRLVHHRKPPVSELRAFWIGERATSRAQPRDR